MESRESGSMPSSSTATPIIFTPRELAASAAVEKVYSSVRTHIPGW